MALARSWRQGGLVVAADDGEGVEDVGGGAGEAEVELARLGPFARFL